MIPLDDFGLMFLNSQSVKESESSPSVMRCHDLPSSFLSTKTGVLSIIPPVLSIRDMDSPKSLNQKLT